MLAERQNTLLMNNNNLRPAGSQPVPEAHAISSGRAQNQPQGPGKRPRRRGKGRRGRKDTRGNLRQENPKQVQRAQKNPRAEAKSKPPTESVCYHCGSTDHWSRICRTPRHLVDLYQASLKGGRAHAHAVEAHIPPAIESNAAAHRPRRAFNVADFVEDPSYEAQVAEQTEHAGPAEPGHRKKKARNTYSYADWWARCPTGN